jgi:hypothetical protein
MDKDQDEPRIEPPGEGEGIEDASKDSLREMKKRGDAGHAGSGDIG